MPNVGDVLDGYRLDAVIGRGGMGTVYRATDLALEKTVALKVIAPHLAGDDTFVQRFREEAKALARLDADGIVDVYTMRETEEALFFVMELVEGPSLETMLGQRGALDPSETRTLLRQVLEAVEHAHASGVLHRDLKPSNILLDDGQAVITDFGLAKILASDAELTATHDRLGTVSYMSPEQVEGLQNVAETSDLFSVGLIAYEALTGRLPFNRSESDFHIQRAIVEESFPPPSTYAPEVSPAVESVVLDLLAKDPTDRPPDAATALRRLPESTADGPVLENAAAPRSESGLSVSQWTGLGTVVLGVLVGVYVGLRATLGLPLLSLSPPSPPPSRTIASADSGGAPAKTARPRPGPSPIAATQDSTADESQERAEEVDSSPPVSTSEPTDSNRDASRTASPPSRSPATDSSAQPAPSAQPSTADASPPASSSSPPVGHLAVRSAPNGAAVRIDDSLAGRTPLLLDSLAPSTYRIDLSLSDHRLVQETIEVAPGDTSTRTFALPPRPAVVRLRVRPSGTVRIDGRVRPADTSGTVIDSLAPGFHRVVLASDLGRWATEVQLRAGERYERTVDFTRQVEAAVTARTPAGTPVPNATVTVDGTQVGYTPQRLTLRVGQHTLRVTKDGYEPVERTVQIDAETETPIVVELSPQSP
ncbi:MAG: protein kinase [Salinibacter sp.]